LIFTIDLQGNITYVSPASEIIVGLKPEEVVGRNFMDFLTESDVPRARRLFADRIAGKDIGAVEFSLKPRAGGAAFIEINSSPIVAEGRLVGIQGIIRDVTGRRRAEDTMRRMQDQLAHVSRLSTMGEMVAGIAHELNQPLYSILNFSKACRNVLSAGKRPDLEQLRDWTEEIASAAARAGAIVTQLRGFARRSESVRLVVSLNEIVEESVQLVASEAQRHRVAVRLEMAGQPAVVKADRIQIQQVMVNLLRNAYEAMEDGGAARRQATIRTELAGDAVEVSVADTGPGLPADPALEIFDAFVTTKPEGLGMGLAISTTIVESHGGRIWAGANPEGGATFRFTLPLANEERADGE
jgi:two-component system sensor kinase FixL